MIITKKQTCYYFFLSLFLISLPHVSQTTNKDCHRLFVTEETQQQNFLEDLAKTSTKKKVFYRWTSEELKYTLLEDGEMNPELYEYLIRTDDPYAGGGLYVAEDMLSSSDFGTSIIQVEVEPGYKYLNLLDKNTQRKLKESGIANEDVYRLNPKIAVTDIIENMPFWVLKRQEGIRFKQFSPREISLDILEKTYIKLFKLPENSFAHSSYHPFLKFSIIKEVLIRAKKNMLPVIGSPFINILEERYGKQFIQNVVDNHIHSLENSDQIIKLLKYAGEYLNQSKKETLINKAKTLPITSIEQSLTLMDHITYKNTESIIKIAIKTPITSLADGTTFLDEVNPRIPLKAKRIIIDKAKSFSSHSDLEISGFLYHAEKYLKPEERKALLRKITSLERKNMEEKIFFKFNKEKE